jgi:hypothetical protein
MSARIGPNPVEIMATASASGCLVFLSIVILPSSPDLTLDDFRPFATSMTLQWYEPTSAPQSSPQRPQFGQDCYLPLGDTRRRCESVWR